jgi:plasmid maintenance system antidote protein VapI
MWCHAMKNPLSPGDFVRTQVVEAAGLTVTATAIALDLMCGLSGRQAARTSDLAKSLAEIHLCYLGSTS